MGGAEQMPYAVPNVRLEYNPVASAVPPLWWRSVEHSFNGFAVESFIDELAAATKQDAMQFRKSLLVKPANWKPKSEDDPDPARLRGVLELAAAKVRLGEADAEGPRHAASRRTHSFGSYFAEVAEVTVKGSEFKIDRIVVAVDCGQIVNPESVRSQAEGAIIYGLSAALKNEITIKDGAVEQTNFDGYDPIRINEAPPIEVHSDSQHGRSRRDGRARRFPPIAPAVANASSRPQGSGCGSCRFS